MDPKDIQEKQNDVIDVTEETGGESMLGLEDFVRLMHSLGDDALESLAEKADAGDAADEKTEAAKPVRKVMHPRRKRILRRQIILLAIPTLLLIATIANIIYYNTAINTDDPITYADEDSSDDVSCTTGSLIVNRVSVAVPTDGNEVYSISYTWSEEDTDYPSVPYASVVSYPGGDGVPDYEIYLYRNDTTKKKDLPSGKTGDNWFDDWDTTESDGIIQEPLSSGKINGFYIHPDGSAGDEDNPDRVGNITRTYYFTVSGKKSVSVYVLEGICYDRERDEEFRQIFEEAISNIKVK